MRTDEKQRYTLRFEPLSVAALALKEGEEAISAEASASPEAQAGTWWIRANQGHSMHVCLMCYEWHRFSASFLECPIGLDANHGSWTGTYGRTWHDTKSMEFDRYAETMMCRHNSC